MKKRIEKDLNLIILSVIFVITIVSLFGTIGPRFFSVNNFQSMAFQVSEFGFLALAMSLAMITGGIDLSIVSNAGLSGIVAATIMSGNVIEITDSNKMQIVLLAIISALLVSTLCGLLNGLLIAKASIPPILATLGTMILFSGIGMAITSGQSVRISIMEFSEFSSLRVAGLPVIFIMLIVACVVLFVLLRFTVFGRSVYLVGQSKVVEKFAGRNPEKTIILVYTLGGFLIGIAGLMMISRVNSARMGFGDSYQLQAILVAVLGGVDPEGGKGNILGVGLAMIVIQIIQSAFTALKFTPYAKTLLWGVLLITVMLIHKIVVDKLDRKG